MAFRNVILNYADCRFTHTLLFYYINVTNSKTIAQLIADKI